MAGLSVRAGGDARCWRSGASGTRRASWCCDFADPELATRFLGDLYQDLSEHAKKTYALLQTPEFVEEFILDQTLEPALAERPLEGFRLIDPTCGSGHFLLGAFERLLDRWDRQAPGAGAAAQRVQQALDAIHGVDINPFAVAIARFRLMVAALQAVRAERRWRTAPALQLPPRRRRLAAASARPQQTLPIDGARRRRTAQPVRLRAPRTRRSCSEILEPGRYDVVVGNPPYITVKDKALNERLPRAATRPATATTR